MDRWELAKSLYSLEYEDTSILLGFFGLLSAFFFFGSGSWKEGEEEVDEDDEEDIAGEEKRKNIRIEDMDNNSKLLSYPSFVL